MRLPRVLLLSLKQSGSGVSKWRAVRIVRTSFQTTTVLTITTLSQPSSPLCVTSFSGLPGGSLRVTPDVFAVEEAQLRAVLARPQVRRHGCECRLFKKNMVRSVIDKNYFRV